jgi:hypothetical protein
LGVEYGFEIRYTTGSRRSGRCPNPLLRDDSISLNVRRYGRDHVEIDVVEYLLVQRSSGGLELRYPEGNAIRYQRTDLL